MVLNDTIYQIQNTNLSGVWYYISYFPKILSDWITTTLNNNNIPVNSAWSSRMILLLSLIILFIGFKLGKSVVKWIIIIIGILLAVSLFIPF